MKRIIKRLFRIIGFLPVYEGKVKDTRQFIMNDVMYLNHTTTEPPPPNTIPPEYLNQFTMNGKIPIIYKYFDDRKNKDYLFNENKSELEKLVVHNTEKIYSDAFVALKNKSLNYYEKEIYAFYDALEKYDLKGKTVLIWGLADCNCDAIALYYGAEKVYVVDYNKPICDHERVEVLSHDQMKSRDIKVDVAFSYSSFEHDGLGRYGDPIDPNADMKAMKEARDRLKGNGVLFLGIPLGRDCLYWNAHRVYGATRLPLLLKGFNCISVYNSYSTPLNGEGEYPFDISLGGYIQCLMICMKIQDDYPEDSVLMQERKNETENSDSPLVLKNINKSILEYKKLLK